MGLKVETVEDNIMKEISLEMGIPFNIVKDIVVNGQSAFTKSIMQSNSIDNVRWPRLGVFKLKHKHAMVKKHMTSMNTVYRKLYRKSLVKGEIFKKK